MFEEINEKYLDALIEKTGNPDFYIESHKKNQSSLVIDMNCD